VEGGEVDARSDLYSLGTTLYFMLTGRPPFAGSAGQVMSQHLYKPVPMGPLAEAPGCVAALVQRLMEKDPRQRPQTARAVQEALLECLERVCGPATGLELASAAKGPLSPGALLAQHYRLLEEVGDSPQGRQFLAEDLRHQRRASLLVLSREFASDALRSAALKDAVERVRQAPHQRLREVYGLETVHGDSVLVEDHAGAIPPGGAAVPRGLERAGSGLVGEPVGAAGRPCPGPRAGARGAHVAGHPFDRPGLKRERDPIGPFTAAADGVARAGAQSQRHRFFAFVRPSGRRRGGGDAGRPRHGRGPARQPRAFAGLTGL
jgi:hypothetical protein